MTTTTTIPTEAPAYLTVSEAAQVLRRKPWPLLLAIEAGELRASKPRNDGCWLIAPADLAAYVDAFANDDGSSLVSRDERRDMAVLVSLADD